MSDVKISALPPVTNAESTDVFPVVQGGVTSKESVTQLQTYMQDNLTFAKPSSFLVTWADAGTQTTSGIYYNGPANDGVAATITNSGDQTIYNPDGEGSTVGDSVLIFNPPIAGIVSCGIYIVTDVGSNSTNWVLTRASYYDSITQINPGDIVITGDGGDQYGETQFILNGIFPLGSIGVGEIFFEQMIFVPAQITPNLVLMSGSAPKDIDFSNSAYPTDAGTAGNVITSDGTNFVSSTPSENTFLVMWADAGTTTTSVTYNNGSSGIGATLTNAGTQTAYTPDGEPVTLGDSVLIFTGFNLDPTICGIYIITDVGSNSTNWVLTRASYFNSSLNILAGAIVTIADGGDTLSEAQYIMYATFPVSVGTSDISYDQMIFVPIINPITDAGNILQSSGEAYPSWSTASYPSAPNYDQDVIYAEGGGFIAGSVTNACTPPLVSLVTTTGSFIFSQVHGSWPLYLKIRMCGGGGGGSGSGTGTSAGAGGNGGNTTVGSPVLLTANGGTGAAGGASTGHGGAGGTAGTINSSCYGSNFPGGTGGAAPTASVIGLGGMGGISGFGCANGPVGIGGGSPAAVVAHTGNGGAGSSGFGTVSVLAGGGGGAGNFLDVIVPNPYTTFGSSEVIPVNIGAAGSAGSAGTSGGVGVAGSAGYVEVTVYYQ